MIPIRDHNPSGRTPFFTYALISINSLIFLFMITLSEPSLEQFVDQFALIPAMITNGQNFFTLITSMFLHGGIGHIVGNMLFLNIFGDNLENVLGHVKFLLYYLMAGLAGSLLQIVSDPTSTIPNLGASGAIAGIMGGYLLLYPRHKIDVLFSFGLFLQKVTLPAYTMLFYWFIAQLFSGVGELAFSFTEGVAYFAHVGGFLAGYLTLLPIKNRLIKDKPRFLGYF